MRGRKPKPTATQIAEGDPRHKGLHKLDETLAAQPKARRGIGECPAYLSGTAKEKWVELVEELEIMQLDSSADRVNLEALCIAYQQMRYAYTAQDSIAIAKYVALVKSASAEFGFSPVSRTRLTIEGPDKSEAEQEAKLWEPRAERPALQ